MAFDWLTISFDLHDNKITKKLPGGGREAKNQPPFWTGGLGRFRKFGGCRRTGGYGRLRGQWVNYLFTFTSSIQVNRAILLEWGFEI